MNSLPDLDIRGFLADPHGAAGGEVVRRLREACHDPGFCYLSGHGVAPALDRAIMTSARQFFALPESQRRALAIANSSHFRGYTVLGDEHTQGASDWREQLDVGPEEAAVRVRPGDPAWLRLRGPNQWPVDLPSLRPAVLDWMHAMDTVGLAILRALAVGLGQPMNHFDAAYRPNGDTHLKIMRYPAQRAETDTGQGVGMHHDSGLLSFVLQDDVGGLQVQHGDHLIEAPPKTGTYVMNLGEMLQAATAGFLRATKHRVVSPPAGKERLSIAYFFHPRLESVFEPIALPPNLAAHAPGGESPDPNDPIFKTFGDNYLKIRLRSHRDVAKVHYPDMVANT